MSNIDGINATTTLNADPSDDADDGAEDDLLNDFPTLVAVTELAHLPVAFVQIALSSLNIFSLVRTSLIHPHLKAILLTQSATFCLNSVAFGCHLASQRPIYRIINIFAINMCNFIGHALLVERMIATWKAEKYGEWRSPMFITILLSAVISLSILGYFFEAQSKDIANMEIFILSIVNSALCFFEIFLFARIGVHSQKRCKQFIDEAKHGHGKLNERYQLNENIRTARQLAPVFLFHFLIVFGVLPLLGSSIFTVVTDNFTMLAVSFCYLIFTTILCALIELSLVLRHTILRKNAIEILAIVRRKYNRIVHMDELHQNLEERHRQNEMAAHLETERHFGMLAKAWA